MCFVRIVGREGGLFGSLYMYCAQILELANNFY
jgi:hypothetical protein